VPSSQRSNASEISVPGLVSKTLMNRSSVKTNIITGDPNPHSGEMKPKILDQSVFNRKKGLSEFKDIMGGGCANRNVDHVRAMNENPEVFRR